ncbi:histidine kinase [Spirosoma knui]
MKIRFAKKVELAFLYISLLGIFGREWVMPGISWQRQVLLFAITMLMLNAIWIFHYWYNDYLDRRLPFEKSVRWRIIAQSVGSWAIVKTALFCCGLLVIDYIIPALSEVVNRLTIITISIGTFFANVVISLGFIVSQLFQRWQANLVRAARLEKEKSQVQYDNLKNQLNPHFLFNSLSSLDGLIDEDPVLARKFLQQLSKVFRYVLQHKEKELVSLATELTFIRNYVSLLKTRFDGSLDVVFCVADEALDQAIVPVTLQVLIENAIKHNTINEAKPLTIRISAADGYLTVENPIQRKRQVLTSNGQGLSNLKMLYQYLSPVPVTVSDTEQFTVRIPLVSLEVTRIAERNVVEPLPAAESV